MIARASKTIARALSRTLCQKGSAAIPACRGRVSVASAVATGAVVNTDLVPCHATPAYSLLGEAIAGGLMYSLVESSRITVACDARWMSENAASCQI
jgi:hypothetical protein